MSKKKEKPTPEAKALSLFLMAYKSFDPIYKERSKRINRLWDLVNANELSKEEYQQEVQDMLDSYGGYTEVIEKTVKYYIDTTGEWKGKGDDKFNVDALAVAEKLMKK